jgi:ribonuclease HI
MRVKGSFLWLLTFILLANLANVISCLVIELQFDGSLRPPNDYGVPTTILGRMAACACTIRNSDDDDNCFPFIIGGKGLTASSTTTSGEVEYEGLLFALTTLRGYVTTWQRRIKDRSGLTIIVKGDCKTVIDQMSGKSNPRKMEHYYRRALAKVHEIEREILRTTGTHLERFQLLHIPRSGNVICDRVSACILVGQELKAYNDVCKDILNHEAFHVTTILDIWFQPGKSLIPLSKRPKLYRCMAELAINVKDYDGLRTVVERYENDIRIMELNMIKAKKRRNVDSEVRHTSTSTYDDEKLEVITYKILAMNALGRHKEAARLQHKKGILLKSKESEREMRFSDSELQEIAVSKLLQNEMTVDYWKGKSDWPPSVQRWHIEAKQAPNWNETWEWISLQ